MPQGHQPGEPGARVERCREALQTLLDEPMLLLDVEPASPMTDARYLALGLALSAWNRDPFPCERWAALVELVAPSEDVFNVDLAAIEAGVR